MRKSQAIPAERRLKIGPEGLRDDEWERPGRLGAGPIRGVAGGPIAGPEPATARLGATMTALLGWLLPGRRPVETPS